jgi:protein-disulfide isomerase
MGHFEAMTRLRSYLARLGVAATVALGVVFSAPIASPATAPLTPDQVRAIVRDYLISNPTIIEEAMAALERKRAAERRVKIERDPRRFVTGPANAKITIVEFFDYRCPYCHAARDWTAAKMKARKDVRWVFVEFPILGPNSLEASRAAIASMKQGRYLPFHHALMVSKSELNSKDIDAIAKSVGIDVARMRRDMNDPNIMALLQADHDLAAAEKIDGTPAYMINGTWYRGFAPDDMDKALRNLKV